MVRWIIDTWFSDALYLALSALLGVVYLLAFYNQGVPIPERSRTGHKHGQEERGQEDNIA